MSGDKYHNLLRKLICQLAELKSKQARLLSWGSPVLCFGQLPKARVATLGLNPSNKEFVDGGGRELTGTVRRFHSLTSLGLSKWSDVDKLQIDLIWASCTDYFARNPYNGWFQVLEKLFYNSGFSFYNAMHNPVCHLDLVPYATTVKWMSLTKDERTKLMAVGCESLGLLLRDSAVEILILNGQTVVESLQKVAMVVFEKEEVPEWRLSRLSTSPVSGYSYRGHITQINGTKLERKIGILGYNHNLQSSFGVTSKVRSAIGKWLCKNMLEAEHAQSQQTEELQCF